MSASIVEYAEDGHLRWQRRATRGASRLTLREIFAISRNIICRIEHPSVRAATRQTALGVGNNLKGLLL